MNRKLSPELEDGIKTSLTVGQRWSMDFMSDQLSDARRLRVFNVIDDFSRQCHLALVETSISGRRVARELVPIPTHSDSYSDLIRTPIPRDSDGPNLLA